jgi:signal transduction histidine kinase
MISNAPHPSSTLVGHRRACRLPISVLALLLATPVVTILTWDQEAPWFAITAMASCAVVAALHVPGRLPPTPSAHRGPAPEKLQKPETYAALLEMSHALSSTLHLRELLKLLTQRTAAACNADVCSIFLWDPPGERVIPMMSQTATGRPLHRLWEHFKRLGSLSGDEIPALIATVQGRAPAVIEDPANSPLVPRPWVDMFRLKSVLSVPLIRQDKVIGGLILHQMEAGKGFNEEQVFLASTIASQVALAIENAKLFEATRERLRESETLLAVSRSVSSTLDLKETLQRVAREAALAAAADSSGAYLLDPAQGVIRPFASHNLPDWVAEPFRRNPLSLRGFPLVQEAFDTRAPVYSNDVPSDPRCAHPAIRRLAFKSCLVAPMIAREKFIGVLFLVWWHKSHRFTPQQVRLMDSVARQAAMAIDNATAYHEIEMLNVSLEDKIAKRTRELSEINTVLEESHRKLQDLDRVKSDFLLNVSHDLRTPLTAIKGAIDNMLDGITGPLTDQQGRYLTRVQANADRLVRLINNLLDLARIEEGRVQVTPTVFSLIGLAAELLDSLRPVATERGLALRLTDQGGPLIVYADRDKMGQVFLNLIDNAIKFTPPGGTVEIEITGEEAEFAKVRITDTGEGIPADELPRIFDKFYQVQVGLQAKTKGTGLGLSIAKGLVELQGGRIWVESRMGRGTTFYVTVPRRHATGLRAQAPGTTRDER